MIALGTIILRHGERAGPILALSLKLGPCSVGVGDNVWLLGDVEADIGDVGASMHHTCRVFGFLRGARSNKLARLHHERSKRASCLGLIGSYDRVLTHASNTKFRLCCKLFLRREELAEI